MANDRAPAAGNARRRPSHNALGKGTGHHQRWEGEDAADFGDGGGLDLDVTCSLAAGELDDPISYAVAATLEVGRDVAGETIRAVAEMFGIAPSTVSKWSCRRRATGSVSPGKFGGHRRPLLEPHREWIEERLAAQPELTLEGLRSELAARGVMSASSHCPFDD